MKAAEILQEAANLVSKDRSKSHGPVLQNHKNIAALWNAYLSIRRDPHSQLTPQDIATMMALLKIARTQLGATNNDDSVDACGYIALAGQMNE